MDEEWKTLPGYEEYKININGYLKNRNGYIIPPKFTTQGYQYIKVYRGRKSKSLPFKRTINTLFQKELFSNKIIELIQNENEFMQGSTSSFFRYFNSKKPNYSKKEIVFELEIKGRHNE